MSWTCQSCGYSFDNSVERHYCEICDAVVCNCCLGEDDDVCYDCEEE